MHYKAIFILGLFLISTFYTEAQENIVADSLEVVLKTYGNDTNRVKTLNELSREYADKKPDKAKTFAENALALAETLKFKKGRSSACNNLGNISGDKGDYTSALNFYQKSLELKKQLGDKAGIATLYTNIGIVYKEQSKNDKAVEYYMLALKMREEIGSKKEIADSYNNIGNLLWNQGKLDSALKYHERALVIRTEIDDKKGIAFSSNNIGGIYNDKGVYVTALTYYFKSLKMLQLIGNKIAQPIALNNIGNIYRYQKRYDEALKMFFQSLEIAKENGNKGSMAECYNKIATVYDNQEKYKDAIEYHLKSIKLKEEMGNKKGLGESYNNIGVVYKYMKNYETALSYFFQALKIKEEIGDKKGLISTNNNIGSVLGKQGKFTEAYRYLAKSLTYAKEVGAKDMLRDNYYIFSETYAHQKNYAKTYEYHLLYTDIKYELFNETNSEQIIAQQTKYETEKKEVEIKILKQQKEINSLQLQEQHISLQTRTYLLVGCVVLMLALVLAGYFYFLGQNLKTRQQREQAIKEAEENERMRLAKDIHDDLGSGLSKIKFLAELMVVKTGHDPEIQSNVRSISATSVNLVENMRDLIWALNPENTSLESLVARIREYSSDYLADFPVELETQIAEVIPVFSITKEAHRNIFFIVKECLQNIIKHSGATRIKLAIEINATSIVLSIADNGQGMNSAKAGGNGLANMRQRASVMEAGIDMISEHGLRVILTVPLKNIKKA